MYNVIYLYLQQACIINNIHHFLYYCFPIVNFNINVYMHGFVRNSVSNANLCDGLVHYRVRNSLFFVVTIIVYKMVSPRATATAVYTQSLGVNP